MTSAPLIAIIEDDPVLGRSLRQRFLLEGFRVVWFTTIAEARAALSGPAVDVVLSDIRLPDGNGGQLMAEIFDAFGVVPTVFMTAFTDLAEAIRLIKLGGRDYVEKPFDLDVLVAKIRALSMRSPDGDAAPFASFGLSAATRDVRKTLDKVANLAIPVLLQGETGTGKDVAARYLHDAGNRRDKPFIAFNCTTIPDTLFDDTLFGHEKGAFTGAAGLQTGLVEQAEDGTLFFDEVGEIGPTLQAKLLRLIEAREYRRLGGGQLLKTDARFVFATNKDLAAAVQRGEFREDLWFRINVVSVELPPLRNRRSEVAPLIDHHIQRAATNMGRPVPAIAPQVYALAETHEWPGNIRELANRAERAVALGDEGQVTMRDFWPERSAYGGETIAAGSWSSLSDIREDAERLHIAAALKQSGGRIQETAALLNISRTTLWEKMRRYGLEASE